MLYYYDYIIVGSGLYGAICARELTDAGYKCLVLEKRDHIGGNCYTSNRDGINVHECGPHIFHTSNEEVWKYINKYTKFNNFRYSPVARYKNELYSLPFNMWTFSQLWEVISPEEAQYMIKLQSKHIGEPQNLEEQAIKLVGIDVYKKLIKGYTEKKRKKPCNKLPASIIKRLPVRFTYDSNYFNDKYQGIPIDGYTQIFEKLLDGIDVRLNSDYLSLKHNWRDICASTIYTGPIDKFYDYKFGALEYKTTRFEHVVLDIPNYQGCAVVNYTDINVPYTRIIEHKHFEFGQQECTWITNEYPQEYTQQTEPMYPVNDETNNKIYQQYKELADAEQNVIFGGRLAEYKYYNMDQVIESALNKVKSILKDV